VSNLWLFGPAIVASGALVAFMAMNHELPGRFPPSAFWVAGGALPLMIYLFVSQLVGGRFSVPEVLTLPGKHVLRFLVLSNLTIFATRYFFKRPLSDWPLAFGFALAVIVAITLVSLVIDRFAVPAKRRR
jgi:hypothetical protein